MMQRVKWAAGALALTWAGALLAAASVEPDLNDAPMPPPFDTRGLFELETPRGAALKLGLDPQTLSVSPDGVVRYVLVATSASGAINVMYEGIRCSTAQHRVYARHHAAGGWRVNSNPAWQSLYDGAAFKYPLNLARSGVCAGKTVNGSPGDILRALKAPQPGGF